MVAHAASRGRSRRDRHRRSTAPIDSNPGDPDARKTTAGAFGTEMTWHAFVDGFYSPGNERLHALGAIDLALWDIKGKALGAPLYQLFGGKTREHIELYATSGLPQGFVPPAWRAQRLGV
jgi:L-alanine-DL-glutamate epimerase-like enolase superfamily enzyme